MSSVASKHPFPLPNPQSDWYLPALLAPSLYLMFSLAFFWGSGNDVLCSPILLTLVGLVSISVGSLAIQRENIPRHRQICQFCLLLTLVYLQLLLSRLWGWPVGN